MSISDCDMPIETAKPNHGQPLAQLTDVLGLFFDQESNRPAGLLRTRVLGLLRRLRRVAPGQEDGDPASDLGTPRPRIDSVPRRRFNRDFQV